MNYLRKRNAFGPKKRDGHADRLSEMISLVGRNPAARRAVLVKVASEVASAEGGEVEQQSDGSYRVFALRREAFGATRDDAMAAWAEALLVERKA